MDAITVVKAFFSALTLVITLQGFVQAQDSLCPLEPVVIHLSRGQKVTISYHVNHGVQQDIVQVPTVTRRPFGPNRVASTVKTVVTTDLDPYEGNGTDVIHPSTIPDFKDASNATESTTDVILTTFENRNVAGENETEITTQPTVITTHLSSTENVKYSEPSNEISTDSTVTEQTSTTVHINDLSTTVEEQSTTLPSSTVQNDEILSTTAQQNDLNSSTVEDKVELTSINVIKAQTLPVFISTFTTTTENVDILLSSVGFSNSVVDDETTTTTVKTTEEVLQENTTLEHTSSTTEEILTSELTTESVTATDSTTQEVTTVFDNEDKLEEITEKQVNDEKEVNDEDKAEEVTDEPIVSEKSVNKANDEDFGGEVEDESENDDVTSTSTQFSTSPVSTTFNSSSASVDEESQTSVNESFILNDAGELDFNITSPSRDDVTSTITESQTSEIVSGSGDGNLSVTMAQTTEVINLSSMPLDEFEKSLLANLTNLTQREIIELNETTPAENEINTDNETETTDNETTNTESETTKSEDKTTTTKNKVSTNKNQDLYDDEIFLFSSSTTTTTTTVEDEENEDELEDENNDNDEEEEEEHEHEQETLLQPILDQILVNNVTDDSRDGRDVESSNSTTGDIGEELEYDEEINEEEGEEEVAHADDTHSYADMVGPFGSNRDSEFVKRDTESFRSERWRRSPRYHVQPNITLCEWHFKTDPGVPLLLSFKNYSIPISDRCEDHHIAVRRTNGYVARWCGKAKESPSHTTFARQELHLMLYSENGPAETGFVAEIQALDTFLLRKAVHKVRPLFSTPH